MTRRIFRSICAVAPGIFLASAALFTGVLYSYFSGLQLGQLRVQASLAAQGAAREGVRYFDGLEAGDLRITWIGADGAVLYDSRSDSAGMENHLQREEIRQALSMGTGESVRYSETLLERSVYTARRLPDGTVLRLSVGHSTLLTLILGMLLPAGAIFAAALAASMALAARLSREIVRPLNELELDDPLRGGGYPELAPLLQRLAAQQRQIRAQAGALRQMRSEFEAVTTGMAEGILLLNEKQVILSINPAAARLFGTDASCAGKYLTAVTRCLALQELLQRAGEGERAEQIMELGGRRYQVNASPVFSEGLASGTVLLLLDVTEKERAGQMRREFTANVSHELKTPLHTISGSAELMAGGLVAAADLPKFSRRIYTEAQRMIRLVEDIISLSRLDEGGYDLLWEQVDLYALAAEAAEALRPGAEAAGVRLELRGEPAALYGVRQMLCGAVYNLCDNAVKYNRRGGSVVVAVEPAEDEVRLTVSDTGIGIPPEHQDRIFERFYRVDKSHSKETGGTGLGLSIVKHAARLHGAAIDLRSEAGRGTSVTLRFMKKPKGP